MYGLAPRAAVMIVSAWQLQVRGRREGREGERKRGEREERGMRRREGERERERKRKREEVKSNRERG